MNYGWRFVTLYRMQRSRPSPMKRSEGGLTNSLEKKRSKKQGRKERYTHLNAEFQRIARRNKKAFLTDQCKEIEGKKQNGKDQRSLQ